MKGLLDEFSEAGFIVVGGHMDNTKEMNAHSFTNLKVDEDIDAVVIYNKLVLFELSSRYVDWITIIIFISSVMHHLVYKMVHYFLPLTLIPLI